MIFDTHTHYDDEAFDCDREELLSRLPEEGVGRICNAGASMRGARESVGLSERYDYIYAAVGVHPDEVEDFGDTEDIFDELKLLAGHTKVVAVGEIGLDYHGYDIYDHKPSRELQKYWFKRQLELATELGLPVVIHSRNASQDTMEMLRQAHGSGLKCADIHCYSYSREAAREYLEMGFYLGFGGTLTYEGQKKLTKALEITPLDRILLETDCPYLTPVPIRRAGEWSRNTSLNLRHVLRKMAEIKGKTAEEMEQITWDNANRFYGI